MPKINLKEKIIFICIFSCVELYCFRKSNLLKEFNEYKYHLNPNIRGCFAQLSQIFRFDLIKDMIKLILIGFLLTLTCQLTIKHYHSDDPLDGLTFRVVSSILEMKHLSKIPITFRRGVLSFKGCNKFETSYRLGKRNPNSFSIDLWEYTELYCDVDHDSHLETLFDGSAEYKLKQDILTFYNKDNRILMVLEAQ